jgi:tRNA (guanine26-N2/guanine27-N2)-dimethyltransferase
MCKKVKCTPPKAEQIRSAVINAGFRVSGSHANPLALKTDAPPQVVWDILRSWIKMHPVKDPEPGSYAAAILGKEIQTQADFKRAPGAVPHSVKQGVPRFVQNPAYWGPKARHGKPLTAQQQLQQEVQAQQRRSRQGAPGQQQQQQGDSAAAAAAVAATRRLGNGNGLKQEQQQQYPAPPAGVQQQQEEGAAVKLEEDWEDELDGLYDASNSGRPNKRQRQQQPAAAGRS